MLILVLSPYSQALLAPIRESGVDVVVRDEIVSDGEILAIAPDWIVSYGYRQLLRPALLAHFADRVINLHLSLLPFNRGADPNFWSWFDGTPGGVSIHRIDAGMDTGPVLTQREIVFDPGAETLRSSYFRLREEIESLFAGSWADILAGRLTPKPQPELPKARKMAERRAVFEQLPDGWDTRGSIVRSLGQAHHSQNHEDPPRPVPPEA